MNKFHLVMPMGGKGSRFSSLGYNLPKPLIPIYDKPFFYWAVKSITNFNDVIDITFVVLKEHILDYKIDEEIKKFFPNAKIVVLDHVLNGPVLTCLEGIKSISDEYPILINDCDHLFKCSEFNDIWKNEDINSIDGALITFKSNLPQFSYVIYKDGKIVGTIEKKVLSNDAICGAYLFKSKSQFLNLSNIYLNDCNYSEYFISGMYNVLAESGGNIVAFNTDFHVSFGTPAEYTEALNDKHYKDLN